VGAALLEAGLTPVIVGSPDEDNGIITDRCPAAIDLTGKTKIMDIITLATHAAFAIGNDTGPMHIAATCLCPVLTVFFGPYSPSAGGPRGVFHRHLYALGKEKLSLPSVLELLPEFIEKFKGRSAFKPQAS